MKKLNKKEQIEYVKKWAFVKYQLNGTKAMNTFIFTNSKKIDLSIDEITIIIDELQKQIKQYKKQKEEKEKEEIKKELKNIVIIGA